MLRIIYAMLSRHAPYQDRAVDYEALTVQRNAPRWIKMLVKHGFIKPATAWLRYEAARDSCVLGEGQPQARMRFALNRVSFTQNLARNANGGLSGRNPRRRPHLA